MFFEKNIKKYLVISGATFFFSTMVFSATPNVFDPVIAAGNAGDVFRSVDGGVTWQKSNTQINAQLSSLIKINNQYVGVGNAGMGVAVRSADGIAWSSASLPDYYPSQVIFANNQYILVDEGNADTSPDAVTWAKHEIPPSTGYPFSFYTGIAWGNGVYVAVGFAGAAANKMPNQKMDGAVNCIATSVDGVNWTSITPTVMPLHSIIFANNQFVATGVGGVIGTSPDGVHWTQQQSGVTEDLGRIVWANNLYMTSDVSTSPNDAFVLTSQDAIHWTKQIVPTASNQTISLSDITYANNVFVLTGEVIGNVPPFGGAVFTSPDGATWTLRASGFQDASGNPEAIWAVA